MPLVLPPRWLDPLRSEVEKPYFRSLQVFVDREREADTVFPPEGDVFAALHLVPPEAVRVLVLGQDPYHGAGQAHGLAFSVLPGVRPPPSLKNIFRELHDDLGCRIPNNGYLVPWAEQGVLLLNAVLTVREGQANSHKGRGWEEFTDAVIRAVDAGPHPVAFVLWGSYAQRKREMVESGRHCVIESAHPSPLSARRGFFGSRPFSRINEALTRFGRPGIEWQIPDV